MRILTRCVFAVSFLSVPALAGDFIPLDRVLPEKAHIIVHGGEEGVPLFGWLGRANPWRVRETAPTEALAMKFELPGSPEVFTRYEQVTEISPQGAIENPRFREYNLPDLVDRLVLSDSLPKGASRYVTSSLESVLVVTRPTLVAASFALDRSITIVNSGTKLVVVCPYCPNLRIRHEARIGAETAPESEVWSYICPVAPKGPGKFRPIALGKTWLDECSNTGRAEFGKSLLPGAWMPQVLLSSLLRNEPLQESIARWKPFFESALSNKGAAK